MLNLKSCIRAAFVAMTVLGAAGCVAPTEGTSSPPIISSLGVSIAPLKDGQVHLTVLPQTVSSALQTIYVRVERGQTTVLKTTLPWNYSQGAQMDVGSAETPLQEGDRVILGTTASNTHVTLPVAK